MNEELPRYEYAGARALVALHDHHLRSCMDVWDRARRANVTMPATEDPDYASIESVGVHLLGCGRHYMTWCCEMLELPDPGIEPAPTTATIAADGRDYLEHVLARWRTPLAALPEAAFDAKDHPSRWGRLYSIDAMLEHAVMHPIRHEYQLENWLAPDR